MNNDAPGANPVDALAGDARAVQGPLSEGDLAEVIAAFNDVTAKVQTGHDSLRREVVRLQEELRVANEQLERSRRLAALGEMAAGIAHEVRNPLGSIGLYARLLEQDLTDRPRERTVAEKIGAAVRGLDAVVVDVLAFAKEMVARAEPVDASELVSRALEEVLAGDRATRPGAMEVRVERVGGDGNDEIVCDPALAHRALVNVVRNAVEAMREDRRGGSVAAGMQPVLSVGVGPAWDLGADGAARESRAIVVRDSGPGVPPDVMERMFNPFFTTRATGTGLGLAIVHRIMDAHGGRVVVRNAGEGAPGSADEAMGVRGTVGAVVELRFPVHGPKGGWSINTRQSLRGQGSPAMIG